MYFLPANAKLIQEVTIYANSDRHSVDQRISLYVTQFKLESWNKSYINIFGHTGMNPEILLHYNFPHKVKKKGTHHNTVNDSNIVPIGNWS
jgi:hypothetical protein